METSFEKRNATKLAEICVTVVAIGVAVGLAMMTMPGSIRAHKQNLGHHLLREAHSMHNAIDQWIQDQNVSNGAPINVTGAAAWMKKPWKTNDSLGNPYIIGRVGSNEVQINPLSKQALAGADIDWGSY